MPVLSASSSLEALDGPPAPGIEHHRDHQQGQQRGHQDAEDQRDGQAVEDGVIKNEEGPDHRRQRGQHNGPGAHRGGLDNRLLQGDAARACC